MIRVHVLVRRTHALGRFLAPFLTHLTNVERILTRFGGTRNASVILAVESFSADPHAVVLFFGGYLNRWAGSDQLSKRKMSESEELEKRKMHELEKLKIQYFETANQSKLIKYLPTNFWECANAMVQNMNTWKKVDYSMKYTDVISYLLKNCIKTKEMIENWIVAIACMWGPLSNNAIKTEIEICSACINMVLDRELLKEIQEAIDLPTEGGLEEIYHSIEAFQEYILKNNILHKVQLYAGRQKTQTKVSLSVNFFMFEK